MKLWKLLFLLAVIAVLVIVPARQELHLAREFSARGGASPRTSAPLSKLAVKAELPAVALSVAPISTYEPLVAPPQPHKPLDGTKIVIDAGHGGQSKAQPAYTGGTFGVKTGQSESDVNLRVSLFLRHYLEHAGAEVIMTRLSDDRVSTSSDKSAELDYRSSLANAAEAHMFISVHHNMSPNQSTNFTTVFYPPAIPASLMLAENISAAVAEYLGTANMGAKEGDYRVLNRIGMPGVIVEASFLSHPAEDLKLQTLNYNKSEAKGIATGILNYLRAANGLEVDFNQIFEPGVQGDPKAMADAVLVGRHIVERKSLFGTRYAEVVYDSFGRVKEWRELTSAKLTKPANATERPKEAQAPVRTDADVDPAREEPLALKSSPRPSIRKANGTALSL